MYIFTVLFLGRNEYVFLPLHCYLLLLFCDNLEPAEPELRRVWNFCASQSRSIEVLYRAHDNSKEILTKTHFNVHAEVGVFIYVY